jgi:hypothetical protein
VDEEINVRHNLELNVRSLIEVANERLNLIDTSEKPQDKNPAVSLWSDSPFDLCLEKEAMKKSNHTERACF